ncbi:hypothetical protein BaRGS_00009011 [Batillaria attramentaria]|uniref:Uncharacterized protein n=1 Tax=Batillaria attramentaria TaxID=370345 RepID=A0ABD0LJH5_9CAEN
MWTESPDSITSVNTTVTQLLTPAMAEDKLNSILVTNRQTAKEVKHSDNCPGAEARNHQTSFHAKLNTTSGEKKGSEMVDWNERSVCARFRAGRQICTSSAGRMTDGWCRRLPDPTSIIGSKSRDRVVLAIFERNEGK